MPTVKSDICIIGAGSGGLSIAAGASQMGASVVLIEGHKMGGDCLNYGCVPSKALIAAAKQAYAMHGGERFGVPPVSPDVDFAAAKDHVARVIATIAPVDSQERFEGPWRACHPRLGQIHLAARSASWRHCDPGPALCDRDRIVAAGPAHPGAGPGTAFHQRDHIRRTGSTRAPADHRWWPDRAGESPGAPQAGQPGDGDRGAEGPAKGRPRNGGGGAGGPAGRGRGDRRGCAGRGNQPKPMVRSRCAPKTDAALPGRTC